MARTAAHRPYKFVPQDAERHDGYDAQKHVGRRHEANELTRAANRRERRQARTDITAEHFDDLAPRTTGRHTAVFDAY